MWTHVCGFCGTHMQNKHELISHHAMGDLTQRWCMVMPALTIVVPTNVPQQIDLMPFANRSLVASSLTEAHNPLIHHSSTTCHMAWRHCSCTCTAKLDAHEAADPQCGCGTPAASLPAASAKSPTSAPSHLVALHSNHSRRACGHHPTSTCPSPQDNGPGTERTWSHAG